MKIRKIKMYAFIGNKRGNEFVEASIVLPLVILIVALMLRVFAFYLEILCAQVESHGNAAGAWNGYEGVMPSGYSDHSEVTLMRGGILRQNLSRSIDTKAYLYNVDLAIRAGEVIDD